MVVPVVEQGIDATGEDFGTGFTLAALNAVVRTVIDEGIVSVVSYATVVSAQPHSGDSYAATGVSSDAVDVAAT